MIDINIPEKDEPLGMVWMVTDQLMQKRGRLQRSVRVGQQEGEVEERAAEVQLELDGLAEGELGGGQVTAVHGEHAEVEVDALVDLALRHDLVEAVQGELAQVRASALLDQHRAVQQGLKEQ
jgi:hypothetical protein